MGAIVIPFLVDWKFELFMIIEPIRGRANSPAFYSLPSPRGAMRGRKVSKVIFLLSWYFSGDFTSSMRVFKVPVRDQKTEERLCPDLRSFGSD